LWSTPWLAALLLRLVRHVGGSLAGAFNLAIEHRTVVLAGATPDADSQLEELLTGLLVHFHPLALLHGLGQLPHQLSRQFNGTIEHRCFGILGRLSRP
jgi:hypothetical protein